MTNDRPGSREGGARCGTKRRNEHTLEEQRAATACSGLSGTFSFCFCFLLVHGHGRAWGRPAGWEIEPARGGMEPVVEIGDWRLEIGERHARAEHTLDTLHTLFSSRPVSCFEGQPFMLSPRHGS